MVRVRGAVASRRRRKRILKRAKGFVGNRKNHIRNATETIMRAMAFNYTHRKQKKRNFRRLWITRIGIAARIHGLPYNKFIAGLHKTDCEIDRKILSELATSYPDAFASLAEHAKQALSAA